MPLINCLVADITDLKVKDIENLLRISENKYGPIEMVICCAAISKPALFLYSDVEQYKHHMDLNYLGVIKII